MTRGTTRSTWSHLLLLTLAAVSGCSAAHEQTPWRVVPIGGPVPDAEAWASACHPDTTFLNIHPDPRTCSLFELTEELIPTEPTRECEGMSGFTVTVVNRTPRSGFIAVDYLGSTGCDVAREDCSIRVRSDRESCDCGGPGASVDGLPEHASNIFSMDVPSGANVSLFLGARHAQFRVNACSN